MMKLVFGYLFTLLSVAGAQSCGQSPFSPSPRIAASYIVGGQNANSGDFPWQVGIVENGYLICGGTYVIGSNGEVVVVTAAHCVENLCVYPEVDYTDNEDAVVSGWGLPWGGGFKPYTLQDNVILYDSTTEFNNVFPSDLSETFASPACLASRDYTDNEDAVVSGWGTTSEGGDSSSTLKYVWKPILNYNFCDTQTGNAGQIDATMLCAGNTGKDACQGDSGGPLVAYRDGKWELVGVVSWGFGCGQANYPGVYADAYYFLNWIKSNS